MTDEKRGPPPPLDPAKVRRAVEGHAVLLDAFKEAWGNADRRTIALQHLLDGPSSRIAAYGESPHRTRLPIAFVNFAWRADGEDDPGLVVSRAYNCVVNCDEEPGRFRISVGGDGRARGLFANAQIARIGNGPPLVHYVRELDGDYVVTVMRGTPVEVRDFEPTDSVRVMAELFQWPDA